MYCCFIINYLWLDKLKCGMYVEIVSNVINDL